MPMPVPGHGIVGFALLGMSDDVGMPREIQVCKFGPSEVKMGQLYHSQGEYRFKCVNKCSEPFKTLPPTRRGTSKGLRDSALYLDRCYDYAAAITYGWRCSPQSLLPIHYSLLQQDERRTLCV